MDEHQHPIPVFTSCTCGRATKRQSDLANAQQDTNEVDVLSRVTLDLHLNIIGAMTGSVWARRYAEIFSYY